jgi:hypothetical protein
MKKRLITLALVLIMAASIFGATESAATAAPSASTVYVNGVPKAFEAYNIGGNNYFKLRDLAYVLSGTEKQFSVDYDNATKAITLTSGQPYVAVGGEMAKGDGKTKTATRTSSKVYFNGKELNLTVYNIGGNNSFKLRDLMQVLDVYVGYDNATKAITLDTRKKYEPEGGGGGSSGGGTTTPPTTTPGGGGSGTSTPPSTTNRPSASLPSDREGVYFFDVSYSGTLKRTKEINEYTDRKESGSSEDRSERRTLVGNEQINFTFNNKISIDYDLVNEWYRDKSSSWNMINEYFVLYDGHVSANVNETDITERVQYSDFSGTVNKRTDTNVGSVQTDKYTNGATPWIMYQASTNRWWLRVPVVESPHFQSYLPGLVPYEGEYKIEELMGDGRTITDTRWVPRGLGTHPDFKDNISYEGPANTGYYVYAEIEADAIIYFLNNHEPSRLVFDLDYSGEIVNPNFDPYATDSVHKETITLSATLIISRK